MVPPRLSVTDKRSIKTTSLRKHDSGLIYAGKTYHTGDTPDRAFLEVRLVKAARGTKTHMLWPGNVQVHNRLRVSLSCITLPRDFFFLKLNDQPYSHQSGKCVLGRTC